ncbi:MAG TPA: carotenoid oxygenase family protein, partial [Rubrobacteraceae bacterium]
MLPEADHRLGFSPLEGEFEIDALPVEGVIPPWLRGTLFRNGPGTWEAGESRMRHWFDGLAMLHRFGFHEGEVSYANKYLRSPQYQHVRREGRIGYSEFAT